MEEYEVSITYRVEVHNDDPVTMVDLIKMVRLAQTNKLPLVGMSLPGLPDFSVAGEVDYNFRGPLEQ